MTEEELKVIAKIIHTKLLSLIDEVFTDAKAFQITYKESTETILLKFYTKYFKYEYLMKYVSVNGVFNDLFDLHLGEYICSIENTQGKFYYNVQIFPLL